VKRFYRTTQANEKEVIVGEGFRPPKASRRNVKDKFDEGMMVVTFETKWEKKNVDSTPCFV